MTTTTRPARTSGPRALLLPLRNRTLPWWGWLGLALSTVLAVAILTRTAPHPAPPPERIPTVVQSPTPAPSVYRA